MAVAHVQHDWDTDTTNATTHVYASGLTVTSGNAIVISVWASTTGVLGGDTATAAVTDNFGNTYTQIQQIDDSVTTGRAVSFVAKNITGGANYTITTTWSAGTPDRKVMNFHEVSGVHLTVPNVGNAAQAQAAPGTGTDAITSSAITPSADASYIFGFVVANVFNGSTSHGTGFTDGNFNGFAAGSFGSNDEYLIQGAAASVAATFTGSIATVNTIAMLVALQPAAAGGGGAQAGINVSPLFILGMD